MEAIFLHVNLNVYTAFRANLHPNRRLFWHFFYLYWSVNCKVNFFVHIRQVLIHCKHCFYHVFHFSALPVVALIVFIEIVKLKSQLGTVPQSA